MVCLRAILRQPLPTSPFATISTNIGKTGVRRQQRGCGSGSGSAAAGAAQDLAGWPCPPRVMKQGTDSECSECAGQIRYPHRRAGSRIVVACQCSANQMGAPLCQREQIFHPPRTLAVHPLPVGRWCEHVGAAFRSGRGTRSYHDLPCRFCAAQRHVDWGGTV